MNVLFDYKENNKNKILNISFCYNKTSNQNQDDIFNKLIVCIQKLNIILDKQDKDKIDKFLNSAKHTNKIKIQDYLGGE